MQANELRERLKKEAEETKKQNQVRTLYLCSMLVMFSVW